MECRLCLCSAPPEAFVSIHDDPHPRRLSQRIWTCCQLRVRKDDLLPDMICLSCVNSLELLNSFRNVCLRSDETSRMRLDKYSDIKEEEVFLDDLIWEQESGANFSPNISKWPDDGEKMEVFQIIPSYSGRPKLNARGYILLLGRKSGDRHYWGCNQHKNYSCPGRAATLLVEGKHLVQKFVEHNHPASPHELQRMKFVNAVKNSARNTNDLACHIIRSAMTSTSDTDRTHLPSVKALYSKIGRIRRGKRPSEP
ncbi:uncharacterized protein LOC143913620 [Arctopsyche grandis]|uniref:uncharacterized protein LOC143913620 n=1 Tax=Arctopsyche grandis TaxID=121162 RepID=UPI00406D708A